DQVRWARSFSLLRERNNYLLWKELDAAASHPTSALQKQYGDYFAACMDTSLVDKKGLEPLQPALKRIATLSDTKQLAALVGELSRQGDPAAFFRFSIQQDQKDSTREIANISQGGLSLPDREYYLSDSKHLEEIRKQYVDHVTKMFTLAGDTP